jgi:hypothetical protein
VQRLQRPYDEGEELSLQFHQELHSYFELQIPNYGLFHHGSPVLCRDLASFCLFHHVLADYYATIAKDETAATMERAMAAEAASVDHLAMATRDFRSTVSSAAPVGFPTSYFLLQDSAVNRRFPGVCRDGLRVGERNDPGNRSPEVGNSPKLGGGVISPSSLNVMM